jgi:hypothetical protein
VKSQAVLTQRISMLVDLGEERLCVEAIKLERAVLQPLDHIVFLLVG